MYEHIIIFDKIFELFANSTNTNIYFLANIDIYFNKCFIRRKNGNGNRSDKSGK